MYWMSEPSKLVRNSSERRETSAQRAKWMNERRRSGAATSGTRRAIGHERRIQSAHHHGIGLSTVSGVARMPAERIARHSRTEFARRRVPRVGDAVARDSDAVAAAGELPLLGRSRELADLRAALEESASGRGALVLLAGEPGIGKTRLASALGDHAAGQGHRVAWARGWDGGGAPAFWPWVQVVRAVAADRDEDELRADLGAGARWVAQLAPELRDRLDLPEPGDLESEQARFALFDAITVFLRNAALREPLLVLLDDLHTADLPSLLLLAFLARSLGESRVVAVTTHHEAGPRRGPEVEAVFGELTRFGRRVELGGLGHDDLRA